MSKIRKPSITSVILEEVRETDPDVLRLAAALSLAVRIDRPLLRAARLEFLPDSHAELEHRLWFGPWVEARSVETVVLGAEYLPHLRRELVTRSVAQGRARDRSFLDAAYKLTDRCTRDLPAVLRLEQEVTWRVYAGGGDPEIERLLGSVLKTLFEPGRQGLMIWAVRAIPRMPRGARKLEVCRRILTISQLLLGSSAARGHVPTRTGNWDWRDWVRLEEGEPLPLHIRFSARGLLLSLQPLDALVQPIPRSSPLAVEVAWNDRGAQLVQLANLTAHGRVIVRSDADEFVLGLADGQSIRVRSPDLTSQELPSMSRAVQAHRRLSRAEWEEVFGRIELGRVLDGQIFAHVTGGFAFEARLDNDIRFPCFLPGSQVEIRPIEDWTDWVGRETRAVVVQLVPEGDNVVVSRREWQVQEHQRRLASTSPGDRCSGIVTSIGDDAAIIDVDGIAGMLPLSEISWKRIRHPSEIVRVGESLTLVVLDVDVERRHLRLGLKQTTPHPLKRASDRLRPGQEVEGVVLALTKESAVVRLVDEIDGLLRRSELSWTERNAELVDHVAVGETVRAIVLGIDYDELVVELGLRQKTPDPWSGAAVRYPRGSRLMATIDSVDRYGAIARLDNGMRGWIEASELTWTQGVARPKDIISSNATVEVSVVEVDEDERRLLLSVKGAHPDPWIGIAEQYPVGREVTVEVINVGNDVATVRLQNHLFGHLRADRPADLRRFRNIVARGNDVGAVVLAYDSAARSIELGLQPVKLRVGESITGLVRNVVDYGAFVDIGQTHGLMHINDIPGAVLKSPTLSPRPGLRVQVRVKSIDNQKGQVSLAFLHADFHENEKIPPRGHLSSAQHSKKAFVVPLQNWTESQLKNLRSKLLLYHAAWAKELPKKRELHHFGERLAVNKPTLHVIAQAALGRIPGWTEPLSRAEAFAILAEIAKRSGLPSLPTVELHDEPQPVRSDTADPLRPDDLQERILRCRANLKKQGRAPDTPWTMSANLGISRKPLLGFIQKTLGHVVAWDAPMTRDEVLTILSELERRA